MNEIEKAIDYFTKGFTQNIWGEESGKYAKLAIESLQEKQENDILKAEGRLKVFPCVVGQTVFVIEKCENVKMYVDDDYFTGTGCTECPFEDSCDIEDCDDSHIRIFETVVTDLWYGDSNDNRSEVFLQHMGHGYMYSDFGKTIFLNREDAKKAINERVTMDNKPCHCFGAMDWILKYSIDEIPVHSICSCIYKTKCLKLTNAKRNSDCEEKERNKYGV